LQIGFRLIAVPSSPAQRSRKASGGSAVVRTSEPRCLRGRIISRQCRTYHAPGGFGTGHRLPDNSLIYVRRPVVPAVLENQGAEMTGSDI
jgi:hypothetical protein